MSSTKAYREKRLAEGLCAYCGKNPYETNKTACKSCLDKKKEESRLRREKKKQGNICLDCDQPALEGKSRCQKHIDNHRKFNVDKRKVLLDEFNLCSSCYKEPALEGYSICKSCIELSSKGEINWCTVFDNSSQTEIMVKNDLRGKQYGFLTVLDYSYKTKTNHYWLCSCECGNAHVAQQSGLITGQIYSCGCQNKWQENQRLYKKINSQNQRKLRLSQGLCSKCGLNPVVTKKTYCQVCLDKKKECQNKLRAEKRAKGECKFCHNKAMEGRLLCLECQNKQLEYDRRRRALRKELNICIDCLEPAEEGHVYCSYHLGLKRFRKALRKENGGEL